MTWMLFLGDKRNPIDTNYIICRSSNEAMDQIKIRGIPQDMALDHDLRGDDTAMLFLKNLENYMHSNNLRIPRNFSYTIHSQNPIGRNNIQSYVSQLIRHYG